MVIGKKLTLDEFDSNKCRNVNFNECKRKLWWGNIVSIRKKHILNKKLNDNWMHLVWFTFFFNELNAVLIIKLSSIKEICLKRHLYDTLWHFPSLLAVQETTYKINTVYFLKIYFNYLSVKYITDFSPCFRKISALNELGWGSQEAQRDAARANWTETKTIPLKLCYLCRNLSMSDPEKRTVELHSPDGKSTCIIRFPDAAVASDWFNAIHSNVTLLLSQCIAEANQVMTSAPNSREIKHIGWLSEQV